MIVISKVVVQMTDTIGEYLPVEKYTYEYVGPLALCDRAAQSAAKQLKGNAGGEAAQSGAMAQNTESTLNPFFQREMGAQHLFTPGQSDELLTAAGANTGAVAGAEQGALERNAASTNNPTALTKNLQELARQRMKGNAGAAETVAGQDVMGAKQLNQEGAAGEGHLFDVNTDANLKAMGLENQALNTELEAGKSGWLQNMNAVISTLTGGKGLSGMKQG